jgi:hypothetical protein
MHVHAVVGDPDDFALVIGEAIENDVTPGEHAVIARLDILPVAAQLRIVTKTPNGSIDRAEIPTFLIGTPPRFRESSYVLKIAERRCGKS